MIRIGWDMNMPEECYECPFQLKFKDDEVDPWYIRRCVIMHKKIEYPRPEWCPLEYQPEIVRCKDCIYCVKEPNGELFCDILANGYEPLGSKKVNEDWYCADGERKSTE